jgi:Spy/CpxP family protein refolding chaperone
MKTTTRRILTVGAMALTLVPAALWAGRHRPLGPGLPPPGFLLQRVVDRLDLTAEQRQEIRDIVKAHGAELKVELATIRDSREQLFSTVHAESVDEAEIRAAAAAVGDAEADLAVTRAAIVQEVREVLTPEQQAEAKQMVAEARARVEELLAFVMDRLENPIV